MATIETKIQAMRISATVLLFVISACSRPEPEIPTGFVQRRIILNQDEYHTFPHCAIKLHVPVEFDTLLTWVDRSDNSVSDQPKYRFTNSKGCLLKESGWIKKYGSFCQDTLDRLTIQPHQTYGNRLGTTSQLGEIAHMIDKRDSIICHAKSLWRIKRREVINKYDFAISSRRGPGYLFCEPYEQLTGTTEFRQGHRWWSLAFVFECKNKDCRNFQNRAYTILKSIKIDTLTNN